MSYATAEELARILKIRTPSTEQTVALQRALDAATSEIDAELGRAVDAEDFTDEELALVVSVNLDRAQEHWQQEQVPFGLMALGADGGAARISTDTWKRHAEKLSFQKQSWGLA